MNAIERLRQIDDAYHRLKTLLSSAHVALLDSGVSVPDFDQPIDGAIRELTAERDRLRTLAGELAGALEGMMLDYGYVDFISNDEREDTETYKAAVSVMDRARKEGVIE